MNYPKTISFAEGSTAAREIYECYTNDPMFRDDEADLRNAWMDKQPIDGRRFKAMRSAIQTYAGKATVLRQLKSGMYLCKADSGEDFQECLTSIKRNLMY